MAKESFKEVRERLEPQLNFTVPEDGWMRIGMLLGNDVEFKSTEALSTDHRLSKGEPKKMLETWTNSVRIEQDTKLVGDFRGAFIGDESIIPCFVDSNGVEMVASLSRLSDTVPKDQAETYLKSLGEA